MLSKLTCKGGVQTQSTLKNDLLGNKAEFDQIVIKSKRKRIPVGEASALVLPICYEQQITKLTSGGRQSEPLPAQKMASINALHEGESKRGSHTSLAEVQTEGRQSSAITKFSVGQPQKVFITHAAAPGVANNLAGSSGVISEGELIKGGDISAVELATSSQKPTLQARPVEKFQDTVHLMKDETAATLSWALDIPVKQLVEMQTTAAEKTNKPQKAPLPNRALAEVNSVNNDKGLRLNYAFQGWGEGHSVRIVQAAGGQEISMQASDVTTRDALFRQMNQWPENLPKPQYTQRDDQEDARRQHNPWQQGQDEEQG